MAIASLKPNASVPIINSNVTIEPKDYNSLVVDASVTPLNSLLGYIEGAPWAVTYYSQLLSSNSDLKEQDIGEANLYQQYNKIEQMEIRVTNNITGAQNTDNAQMAVSGSALVYPFLTPNVGDMFVAGAGYGQVGIYRIKSVERKSFNKMSVYSIDYNLMIFVVAGDDRLVDLDQKSINTYVFDKNRFNIGQVPTLSTADFNNLMSLREYLNQIVTYYFKTFYYKEFDTLIIPSQNTGAYDAFLTDYIMKMVDTSDAYEIRLVRNYVPDGDPYMEQETFWTAMFNRDINILKYCNRQMGLVSTKFFNYNSMFKGIRFSRLSYVIYPVNPDFSLINPNSLSNVGSSLLLDYGVFQDNVFTASPIFKPQATQQLVESKTQGGSLKDILNNTYVTNNVTYPIISPILEGSSYVLSDNFYSQAAGQSLLESLVSDYINRNPLNLSKLVSCIQPYRTWGRLEQFYYLPILITLIKSAMVEPTS